MENFENFKWGETLTETIYHPESGEPLRIEKLIDSKPIPILPKKSLEDLKREIEEMRIKNGINE